MEESTAVPKSENRLFYGWVMLPVAMLILAASSPGQTYGITTFNTAIRDALRLSHTQISAAYMLGTILGSIPITYVGWLMDRHGLRWTMLRATLVMGFACLLLASAMNWIMLVCGFCFLRMIGPGMLALISGNTMPFWFERKLGMVEGIRKLSGSAAMGLIPIFNLWMLSQLGWRGAYLVWGAVMLAGLWPVIWFAFRDSPKELGQEIDNGTHPHNHALRVDIPTHSMTVKEAMRTPAFWIVSSGGALFAMIATAIMFHLEPIMLDSGLTKEDAAKTITAVAISMACSQFASGVLSDYIRSAYLLGLGLCLLTVTTVLLTMVDSSRMALYAGLALGSSQGFYFGSSQPIFARYFGREHLGKIRGLVMTAMVACSSLGPIIAGFARDTFGSFENSMLLFSALPVPLICMVWLVKKPTMAIEQSKQDGT